ncbi:unnamed protein product [Cunninghamella blakesleeana]
MYSGHLAPILVLSKKYPNVSPFVFSFGVGVLDIAFGILSYFEYEGLTLNPEAGYMGADGYIDYSHSLLGTVILSTLFGIITGQFVPGFLAVFSHFIGDWLVHNQDLVLDPFTKIKIGGTGLWGNHPTFSFYLELTVILLAACFSSKDLPNYSVTGILLYLHWMNRPSAKLVATELANIPKEEVGMKVMISMFIYFGIPALLIGSILTYGHKIKKNKQS